MSIHTTTLYICKPINFKLAFFHTHSNFQTMKLVTFNSKKQHGFINLAFEIPSRVDFWRRKLHRFPHSAQPTAQNSYLQANNLLIQSIEQNR